MSKKHGIGHEQFPNGDSFNGNFKHGHYQGQGTFTWSNGSWFVGEFKDGLKHGNGKWVIKDYMVNKETGQEEERISTYTGAFEDDCK